MPYFVFYDDDYPNSGGIGWEEFNQKKEVEEFITTRMKTHAAELDSYCVIKGKKLDIKIKMIVTSIELCDNL